MQHGQPNTAAASQVPSNIVQNAKLSMETCPQATHEHMPPTAGGLHIPSPDLRSPSYGARKVADIRHF